MWQDVLLSMSGFVRPYIFQISTMIIATLLVLYGDNINRALKRQISHYHFLIRTLIFILVCAFGYGLLLTWLVPVIANLLASISGLYLGVVTLGILIALGLLAERKRVL
ncbi:MULTISPECIES: DUF3392 family protein [Gammaproteobacteria]|uniref:DUF3392 family protein n=1 Tax=Gammaproteobacteria TaxID=1236 RepID=UPI000DCF978B|nr:MULTISPECIES: DUF3392 family protein [Gammaproteobacteria]RTE87046.1 DUF3392 family protein [Aliidiomarina sp. B3213]TCZ93164.1 DUF3392 family protein [Lysobacter sp. N42]